MNKRMATFLIIFLTICLVVLASTNFFVKEKNPKINKVTGIVLNKEKEKLTVKTDDNMVYTFNSDSDLSIGDSVLIEYTGLLSNDSVVNCILSEEEKDENGIFLSWKDDGIFKDYYILAKNKLDELSMDEKIGQLLLVKYPSNGKDILKEKQFSGYIFYENDFKDKTEEEVISMISSLNEVAKIPLLIAVDEEGGDVVRVSSNKKLRNEPFLSPSELYKDGGFSAIEKDTVDKSNFLKELGINLNLAPVIDVANSDEDYIYERTLKEDTEKTSEYAKRVISASKNTGVSYTLKHFPGYGDNEDTHNSKSIDERSLQLIKEKDLPPFVEGIKAGAEAILVNHNVVKNIDEDNSASLSSNIHEMLRDDLEFTGVIITDDMDMEAVSDVENSIVKALIAGNDLVIVGDYDKALKEIKEGIENNILSENLIDKLAFRVLAWKYYKGLLFEVHK